jgi:IPTL-CTERM motif
MSSVKSTLLGTLFVSILIGLLPAAPAAGQPTPHDIVTVATVNGASGGTIDVPVYINDLSGSTLGLDQPAGSRIQSYGLRVTASNAAFVQSMTLTRGGITQSLTPTFESNPSAPGVANLIDTFSEATNLIPFTLNGAAPGNQVATLHVTLIPAVPNGTVITLTLDTVATELTNESGTPATAETVANGRLVLVNGAINVSTVTSVPTLTQWALILLAVMLAAIAIRIRL